MIQESKVTGASSTVEDTDEEWCLQEPEQSKSRTPTETIDKCRALEKEADVSSKMTELGFDLSLMDELQLKAIIDDGQSGGVQWKAVMKDVERVLSAEGVHDETAVTTMTVDLNTLELCPTRRVWTFSHLDKEIPIKPSKKKKREARASLRSSQLGYHLSETACCYVPGHGDQHLKMARPRRHHTRRSVLQVHRQHRILNELELSPLQPLHPSAPLMTLNPNSQCKKAVYGASLQR